MKTPYKRLPGRRWLSIGLIHKCWLGPDHLLTVEGSRYNENYQRFDLGDIQTLICRRTRRRLAIGLGLGIPAALILLVAASQGWSAVAATLFLTVPLVAAFTANLLRGPTCVTQLRTAVSVVDLPSLSRVRSFERAIRVLRPRIEAAQGRLTATELQARLALIPPPAPGGPSAATVAQATPRVRPYRGAAHDVLFGLLIALGLVGLLRTVVQSSVLSAVVGTVVLAVVVALVAALVRQQESDLAPQVRRLVWAAIGYLAAAFTIYYTVMMIEIALDAKSNQPDAIFRYIVGESGSASGLLGSALSLVGIGIGLVGWLRLREFRAQRRSVPRPAGRSGPPPLHP